MSNLTKNVSPEDKKMLNSIFLRSFSVFASCAGGSVKAGADGWLYSVQPALNRYYADDPEARAEAMKRHTTWYNITQNVGTFAMGLVASMERENSQHEDFDTESIDGIKVSLWARCPASVTQSSGASCVSSLPALASTSP